jgi:WD40 repeat protein
MMADTDGSVLGFASDDELFLNCGDQLRKYNLATGEEVCVSPEGSSIISVTSDSRVALLELKGSLLLWDVVAQKRTAVLTAAGKDNFFEVMSDDGRMVAIVDTSEPHTIRLYDATLPRTQERTIELGANTKIILRSAQVAFSPDGSFLAAFGGVGNLAYVWVWDTRTGAQVAMLRSNHSPMWSHNGRLLITRGPGIAESTTTGPSTLTASALKTTRLTSGTSLGRRQIYLLPDRIGSLAFSPDERQLLSNGVTWDVVNARDPANCGRPPKRRPPTRSLLPLEINCGPSVLATTATRRGPFTKVTNSRQDFGSLLPIDVRSCSKRPAIPGSRPT